jgi:hypothetical protein
MFGLKSVHSVHLCYSTKKCLWEFTDGNFLSSPSYLCYFLSFFLICVVFKEI